MGKFSINDMKFYAFHGVEEYEQELGQSYIVDLEMTLVDGKSFFSDELSDALDYYQIYEDVRNVVENKRFKLLEALAEKIAGVVLLHERVKEVKVAIQKQFMPVPGNFMKLKCEIERKK